MRTSRSTLKNIHNLISAASDKIGVEQMFLNDLCATIPKLDERRPITQTYKPSSLICMRNMYYMVTGVPAKEKADEQLMGMGDIGSHRHESLQRAISKMHTLGIDCEWVEVDKYVDEHCKDLGTTVTKKSGFEYKCHNSVLNMNFLCDGIIKYKGEYYILEIKTESNTKHYSRKCIAVEHKTQASCYSTCFGIFKVIFIYESRDNCAKKSYLYETTRKQNDELVASRIYECDQYIKKGVVPPVSDNKKDCTYCNYVDQCRRDK